MKAYFSISLALIFLASTTFSCSKDEEAPTTFQSVINQGDDAELLDYPSTRSQEEVTKSEPYTEDYDRTEGSKTISERFICTTKKVSVTDGNGMFPMFSANDQIYPGNLLQGNSLDQATPNPIVVKRAGGTISYDLNNGNLQSAFTVDEVKKSTISTAMNNIIANAGSVVPADFNLEILQIDSESQLAMELGVKVSTLASKTSGNLSFSTDKQYSRTLVKLTQQYYTMSFDLPTSLGEIFDPSVTPAQLSQYVSESNPATFISSVTYGRIFYMLIESTSSRREMELNIDAAYKSFGNEVSGNVDVASLNKLKNLKIKVVAYGGTAQGSFSLAGETNIEAIQDKLEASTDIAAGKPLSYVVRSVKNPDRIVGTKLATEYDIVDCELKGVLPLGLYRDFVDLFEDGIGAMTELPLTDDVLLFNMAGDKYAWFNSNKPGILSDGDRRIFSITDETAPLGKLSIPNVGSAVRFADDNVARLYIFSKDGSQVEIVPIKSYTPNTLPSSPIGTPGNVKSVNAIFGDGGNFLIGSAGIGGGVKVGRYTMAFFDIPGDRYQFYVSNEGGWDTKTYTSNGFFANQNHTGPNLFNEVGAGAYLTLGRNSGRFLFINKEGNELMEFYSYATTPDVFAGPWVIN